MKHQVEELNAGRISNRTGEQAQSPGRDGKADGKGGMDPEMMKKMETLSKPGAQHKALEAMLGEWSAEVKCWGDPGGQANISKGTARANWILNNRYLEEEFKGEMMGKPFTGRTTLGYDNVKQEYQSVWISDNQTGMFFSHGKGDSKSITLEGQMDCPVRGKNITFRSVYRFEGPDKHIFEMYDGSQGNAKTMEITYTRRGK